MIIDRLPQRAIDDCAICSVAAVLGYPYEQVQKDRTERYSQFDGRTAWWEQYLEDEGPACQYRSLMTLEAMLGRGGEIVGLHVMQQHQLRAGHVVAIDELGYVDPSDGFSDHVPFEQYPLIQAGRGFVFERDFLAISNRNR